MFLVSGDKSAVQKGNAEMPCHVRLWDPSWKTKSLTSNLPAINNVIILAQVIIVTRQKNGSEAGKNNDVLYVFVYCI